MHNQDKNSDNNLTTDLPNFPDFVSLEPKHQAILEHFINTDQLYSDYNFVSLWCWDHQKKLQLCILNNNLVIKFQDYLDAENFYYSYWGKSNLDETAKVLLSHSSSQGKNKLKLIPQFVVEKLLHPEDFIITEDRDSFDYIVAIKDMVDPTYMHSSKRRYLSKFMENYSEKFSVKELDFDDPTTITSLMEVVENWANQSKNRTSYSENELFAIRKILHEHHKINTSNLHIVGIYLDDKVMAFSINEILKDGFAMGHFKKANREVQGLGVALDHFTAKSLSTKGVSHLNHEQDLGIEGLRQAKLANNPVYFLKKYTISLAK